MFGVPPDANRGRPSHDAYLQRRGAMANCRVPSHAMKSICTRYSLSLLLTEKAVIHLISACAQHSKVQSNSLMHVWKLLVQCLIDHRTGDSELPYVTSILRIGSARYASYY